MTDNCFRNLLYPLDHPRLAAGRGLNATEFGHAVLGVAPVRQLIDDWKRLQQEPFRGITCDGHRISGLYTLSDDGVQTSPMVAAAHELLALLSAEERVALTYPMEANEWRSWSNPEFLINPNGLRLEDVSPVVREAILRVMKASMSPAGFEKAMGCMRTNGFLGSLCGLPEIMNENSYNFLLFGAPGEREPWGWNIYGHHLALNCVVLPNQVLISPTFMGAEPNIIDEGPYSGLRLFDDEERFGLALMRSLSPAFRERATIYDRMKDPEMPPGRWHFADERHLGGAFQDNRIVPYEGICAADLSARQRQQLMDLISSFVAYLPKGSLEARLTQIENKLDETWWSWIGGQGDDDPFYYRVQSPVVMIEFDHHSGVWLANEEPAKCHIHTVVRTPNGNDYGKDLLKQHYQHVHPGRQPGHD